LLCFVTITPLTILPTADTNAQTIERTYMAINAYHFPVIMRQRPDPIHWPVNEFVEVKLSLMLTEYRQEAIIIEGGVIDLEPDNGPFIEPSCFLMWSSGVPPYASLQVAMSVPLKPLDRMAMTFDQLARE
jgi:hypothetical protein